MFGFSKSEKVNRMRELEHEIALNVMMLKGSSQEEDDIDREIKREIDSLTRQLEEVYRSL